MYRSGSVKALLFGLPELSTLGSEFEHNITLFFWNQWHELLKKSDNQLYEREYNSA